MQVRVTHTDIQTTGVKIPDFPMVRFDSGHLCYTEALVNGRYLGVHCSAMGRPISRALAWQGCRPPQEGSPWPSRWPWRSAFMIEINGQELSGDWNWVHAKEIIRDDRSVCHEVCLRNVLEPVELRIHTRLDGTSFAERTIELTNKSSDLMIIGKAYTWSGRLWSWSPMKVEHNFQLGRMQNCDWGKEGDFDWQPLSQGRYSFDSVDGKSGWSTPSFLLRNVSTGETFMGSLGWSGNWTFDFLFEQRYGEVYVRAGINGSAPLKVLQPGETAILPSFHFALIAGGLEECVNEWHTHLRRSVIPAQPAGKKHLIECNHTGYTMNAQITEEALMKEIDIAAEIGCELFLVDAGWYGDSIEGSWASQVGDWKETPLLKNGLNSLFDKIRQKGMKCGLWVEIERMVITSNIAREHPEWFMVRDGQTVHQLDLSIPEVESHVFTTLCKIIDIYKLDCYRIDHNISINEGGNRLISSNDTTVKENTIWRYYDALYRVFDRIKERYPDLLLENCSGGGGRIDAGIMSRFHWTQVTDMWDPQQTLKIINGMSLVLAPEQVETLLGAISFNSVSDLDFMLRIGLFGHFCVSGIYPSLEEIHQPTIDRWKHALSLYKSFVRPMIDTSRLFHHTPVIRNGQPGEWCVLEMASDTMEKGMVGVWRFPAASGTSTVVYPRGTDPEKTYKVTLDSKEVSFTINGLHLMQSGIRIELDAAGLSELIMLEKV